MPREYDKEIQKKIIERQQRAAREKEERIRERNKILLIGGAGLLALILVIAVIAKIAGGGSSKKEVETTTTKAIETTTEQITEAETTTAAPVMKTTDTVNLRKEGNTSAEIITQVPAGKIVTVLSNDGSWCQVTYEDKQGYISAEFLKIDESAESAEGATSAAIGDSETTEVAGTDITEDITE